MVMYLQNDPKPPLQYSEVEAQVHLRYMPTSVRVGYTATMHIHMAVVGCTVVEIISKIDRMTLSESADNCNEIKSGELARVRLRFTKKTCVEKFAEYPILGRFSILDGHDIVMIGIVLDVIQVEEEKKK